MFNKNYLINPLSWSGLVILLFGCPLLFADIKGGDQALWAGYLRSTPSQQSSSKLVRADGAVYLETVKTENQYDLSLYYTDTGSDTLKLLNPSYTMIFKNFILGVEKNSIEYKDFFPVLRMPLHIWKKSSSGQPKISFIAHSDSDAFKMFLKLSSPYDDCIKLKKETLSESYFNQPGYVSNFTTVVYMNRNVMACTISKRISDKSGVIAVFVKDFPYGAIEVRNFRDIAKWKTESEKIDLSDLTISSADEVLRLESFTRNER